MEVSPDFPGVVPVRDSKVASGGPVIVVTRAAWAEFVAFTGGC
ncbi:DUF397 domain-containing protein [Streptomyces sp. NPDC020898]